MGVAPGRRRIPDTVVQVGEPGVYGVPFRRERQRHDEGADWHIVRHALAPSRCGALSLGYILLYAFQPSRRITSKRRPCDSSPPTRGGVSSHGLHHEPSGGPPSANADNIIRRPTGCRRPFRRRRRDHPSSTGNRRPPIRPFGDKDRQWILTDESSPSSHFHHIYASVCTSYAAVCSPYALFRLEQEASRE